MAANRTRRVTLADVAARAGVSRTTASYILGQTRGGFSKETVERVSSAAKELGFRPNPIAQSLRTGRTRLLGLIVASEPRSAHAYNRCQVEMGIAAEAGRHKLDLVQVVVSPDIGSEIGRVGDLLRAGLIEGLILTASRQRPIVGWLRDYGAAFVVIGSPDMDGVTSVDIDNVGLGKATARHLIDLGHRKLLCIAPPDDLVHGNDRAQGFLLACGEAGIDADQATVVRAQHSRAGGYSAMKEALSSGLGATGVCACDDSMAYGAIAAIREANLSVPADISVVGCNDDHMAGVNQDFLTTVELDFEKLGALAAGKLVALLEDRSTPRRELIGFRLLARESSGPARRGD
jgi:LacI family transcriptional regulator